MAMVETVRGPVDSATLERTYMHEHIFVLTPDVQQNYPGEWGDEDARIADAVDKLGALSAQGVRTIVDPTVIGLGRYIPRIQRVAEQLPDLNIIVATGCYAYGEVPFFFHHRGPALNEAAGTEVPDPMVDLFVGDIEDGIAGDRRQGRPAQVRHRPAGPHAGCGAGDACGGQGASAHRHPDHRAHPPRGAHGVAGQACAVRRGGRGPGPGRARTQR